MEQSPKGRWFFLSLPVSGEGGARARAGWGIGIDNVARTMRRGGGRGQPRRRADFSGAEGPIVALLRAPQAVGDRQDDDVEREARGNQQQPVLHRQAEQVGRVDEPLQAWTPCLKPPDKIRSCPRSILGLGARRFR